MASNVQIWLGMFGNGWGCPGMAGRSVVVRDYKRKARKRFAIFLTLLDFICDSLLNSSFSP